ncbi:hypothetical protein AC792_08045 [Arthrobacter sp. RIT-PI-e]|uniref:DUF1304 domain-containing protein n=1 Tax=Arthrobacter sp. RIT-PI-e TaxID=1681197 RepID=UPI0006769B65|nr:DUF1304 domain-containing protein [Arthrobacter sp. RIT-PI-e]KNC19068.1 hypothetical protein AC792_08045 [Arthrobacter sp. RIT-PI-e]
MILTALILTALAILLHVYIFWMESLAWEGPQARRTFGPASDADVEVTKDFAFNQGFYNLFLALIALMGLVLFATFDNGIGAALILAGVGSMAAAALVLFVSDPTRRGAAVKQGTIPLAAIIATLAVVL